MFRKSRLYRTSCQPWKLWEPSQGQHSHPGYLPPPPWLIRVPRESPAEAREKSQMTCGPVSSHTWCCPKSLSVAVICYAALFVVTEKRQNYLRENSADSVLCLHPKVPKRNRIVGILPPFFFLVTPHGMCDLNSLTRDQTHAPWNGSTES